MGIFSKGKKSSDEVANSFLPKNEEPVSYTVENGEIHFGELDMTSITGLDIIVEKTDVRLCNWSNFHIFAMSLVSGWAAIESMLKTQESVKKGRSPDILKKYGKKAIEELKNYKPPENYYKVLDEINKMGKDETDKVLELKKKLGDMNLIKPDADARIKLLGHFVAKEKKLPDGKTTIRIKSITYKKPVFSVKTIDLELKLLRFFILRDEITPKHAKLILPLLCDFLDTVKHQPGVRISKETIKAEEMYLTAYINHLKNSIKNNKNIIVFF